MFQTLQPQTFRVKFRVNQTGVPTKNRTRNLDQRPHTVDVNNGLNLLRDLDMQRNIDVDRHQSLKTAKQKFYRTIDDAEVQLTNSFRNQMSPYIQQKIRYSLSRNHQRRRFFSRNSSYHDNPEQESDSTPLISTSEILKIPFSVVKLKNIKFSTILNQQIKSPTKSKEFVFESIITNTKQRIDRIIGLKIEKQQQYQNLKKSIEKKCLKKNQKPIRTSSFVSQADYGKPPTIETLQWDKQWKQELKKESNRYRNRLFAKHKRQMSMKIQLPDQILKVQ